MKRILLILMMLTQAIWVFGQAGKNDLSFNGDLVDFGHGPNSQVTSILKLDDGHIMVGGFFNEFNGFPRRGLAKLKSDGSLDHNFNITSFIGSIRTIAQQDDGLILLGGSRNSSTEHILMRVQKNGNIDPDFRIARSDNGTINNIIIQPDGKILVVGTFTQYDRTISRRIVRLNQDGTRDTNFDIGEGANNAINVVKLLDNGKILIGGTFNQFNGFNINRLARLNQDGSLDQTFQIGTGPSGAIQDIEILENGDILVGGSIDSYDGKQLERPGIIKLNQNGTLIDTFSFLSDFFYSVQKIKLRKDGKIFVALNASNSNANGFALLNSDGSKNSDFTLPIRNSSVQTIELLENDQILIGGSFTEILGIQRNYISRITSNGALDNTFNTPTGIGGWPTTINSDEDGKIIVGGNFISYNGQRINHLVKLNESGEVDSDFSADPGFSSVSKIELQGKDHYLIIGGRPWSTLVRLNKNGTLDTQFGSKNNVLDFDQQSDGKIVAVGSFSIMDGRQQNRIVRFDKNGVLDNTFLFGSGPDNNVNKIIILEDDKMLLSGSFLNFNGVRVNGLVKLNPDGSLDQNFTHGLSTGVSISAMALQKDGKIVIAGNFSVYNGMPRNRIARINSDGSLDQSFDVGSGIRSFTFSSPTVNDIKIDRNGRILIGGNFEAYGAKSIKHFAGILPNGSLDQSFDTGIGPNSPVQGIAIQQNNKILLVGGFTSFDNTSRVKITRLLNDIVDTDPPLPDKEILPAFEAQCVVNFEDLTIPTATDNEGETIQGTTDESIFPIITQGSTTITWTYTDADGNSSTQTQEIQIKDTELPEIQAGNDITVESDEGLCEAMVEIQTATANDNCEVGAPTGIRSDGEPLDAPYPVGLTSITWNVTDINGNEAEEVVQSITVNDKESPVITAQDQSVSSEPGLCSAMISLEVNATDNCGVGDPIGSRSDGEPLDAPYSVGLTTITWNVTDINGNEAETVIQTITITDDEAPEVFTKNAIIELQPGGSYTLSSGEIDDGSFDNCGIASKTLDKTLFTEDDEGENMVILTVVDLSGNENSAEATVTVIVNREGGCVEAKAKDMILVLDRNGTASLKVNQVDDGSFTNCSNRIVSRELEKSLFTCADLGEQTVSFKAIDSDGNTGETRIKVTVLDDTAPIIRNFPRININLGADETYILADLGEVANIFDNCSIESVIQSPEPGTVYDTAGTYSILLKATDTSGNVGERTVTLRIRKNANNRLADGNETNREGNVESSDLDTMSDQDQVSANSEINLENQLLREIISNGFKIYPNPANQETNVLVNLVGESNVEIRIFDAAGRLVFSEESFEEQSFTRNVRLDGLSSGLYNVVVKVNHQYLQGRLIKK